MSCIVIGCFGQKKLDKTIDKADAYYKSMKYQKAIPLYYEAIETKGKHTLALRTKLAYCYRMLNQMDKAEELYSEIVTDKKARAITFYYYGEALMANGKYDEAKAWFLKYDEYNPKDNRGITMAAACEKAKTLRPIFPDITLSRMTFNTAGDDYAPMYYNDGLLFVSDNVEEDKKKMEYEWTGRAFSSIYYAEADSASVYDSEPLPFSRKFNKRDKNSGPSSMSGNGKRLYFSRNNDVPNKAGTKYTMAIYMSERSVVGWEKPVVVPICNTNFSFMHPAASYTGDTLYFISDKPGGFGETDIYMTYRKEIKRRNKKGDLEIIEKWVLPTNLGEGVNTAEREAFPYLANDGKLYFSSKGHPGFGGFDLFMASANEEFVFEQATNLGSNINSPKDDMSIIFSSDKRTGYFASNRLSGTDDDIFAFRKGQRQIVINGEVMSLETKEYIKDSKITLRSYDDNLVTFSDEQGNFQFKVKPGKEYTLNITRRGYAPYEYPIDATKLKDGEVLPFLIKLRQLEDIPYAHIDHEQSVEEVEPDLSMYEPIAEEVNEEIDPYKYLPPSIPARGLVAKHVKKVVDEKQAYYRNELENKKTESRPEAAPIEAIEEESIPTKPKPLQITTKRKEVKKKKVVKKKENKVVKPQSMEEAPVHQTEEVIPSKQQVPEADVNQMFMDLDVINESNQPLNSVVIHLMNEKGQLLESIFTDYGGNVELLLKPKRTYMLKLERSGFRTKTIMVCTDRKASTDRLSKKVLMKQYQTANAMTFDDIQFTKGEYQLSELATVELDMIVNAMENNPAMVIQVTGFTDALGDLDYNKKLSKKRSMEVGKYLMRNGINPTRIILKGKGATELSNGCKEGIHCSEKLHQENRRVSIVVTNQ